MARSTNKITQFWEELKRRNVARVITVYAGAAFVILEVVDIVAEPLKLPSRLLPVAIVLLSIGFIIAIILSWIYDVKPEGGIIKTEPVQKTEGGMEQQGVDLAETGKVQTSSTGWRIASYISFIVIVGLIVLNVLPRLKGAEAEGTLDRSIAVLPFINDSPEKENEYFLNGIMEELLIKLQTIEDLRVVSRSSVEQFRDQRRPSISEIAERLDVNYIVEGSGQRYGNTFTLRIQLIKGSDDDHLWAKSYEEQLESVELVSRIHTEIAESISAELKAIITPEEKQIIEKIPTTSLSAYDFYQRGRDEYIKYWLDNNNIEALNRAEDLYHTALEYDTGYALAYVGLARIYWHKNYWSEYFQGTFLDSVLVLSDIAISYDDKTAEAYVLRGDYYREKGDRESALKEYNEAIEINPNEWQAFRGIGLMYSIDDGVKFLENNHKAASLNHGPELPVILRGIAFIYHWAGFVDLGRYFLNEALRLDGDSISYLEELGWLELTYNNFEEAIRIYNKVIAKDSTRIRNYANMGLCYMYSGDPEESLRYLKIWLEKLTASGQLQLNEMQRVGYAYWVNGYKEEAEHFFELQMEYCNNLINSGRPYAQTYYTYYDRASVYAFRGDKEKAFADLNIFNRRDGQGYWFVNLIKVDPLFDGFRDEPEFQQIVSEMEIKSQAEHERVRQWLEENEML